MLNHLNSGTIQQGSEGNWEEMTKEEWCANGADSDPAYNYDDLLDMVETGEWELDGVFTGQSADGLDQPVFTLRDGTVVQAQHYQNPGETGTFTVNPETGEVTNPGHWEIEKTLDEPEPEEDEYGYYDDGPDPDDWYDWKRDEEMRREREPDYDDDDWD